jgi:signal transduction histidine kinase
MTADDPRSAKVLIVDDEPTNVRLLERVLATAGYAQVHSTTDAREALDRYRSVQPDLVLLDLMMPHLDGIAVLGQLQAEIAAADYVPVVVLTADVTPEARRRALAAGASDFLTKPFEQTEVLLRIRNMLHTRHLYRALAEHNRSLETLVRERTERLLQSEKVATMGSLLAGVAHELNNPLAVLTGHAQLLRDTAQDETLIRRAEKISHAADRCVRIVRSFLALARQRAPERSRLALNRVVAEVIELLGYELKTSDVQVVQELDAELPEVWADAHQIHQVVVNLVANAYQALRRHPRPRRITICTRHESAQDRLVLEVSDTGPGIPSDIRAKIFEPFFTTKASGEGTGLGLSLCRGIVQEHGGTIDLDAATEQGTRFIITLPIVDAPDSAESPGGADAIGAVAPRRVLVVDDESELAGLMAEAIAADGHEVTVALNGAIALEMLARFSAYDVIVSDTKMPELDGEGLYAEVARRYPALRDRIIFLTGDVLSREKRAFLEQTGRPFLEKPCDLADLRRLVHRVAAGPMSERAA